VGVRSPAWVGELNVPGYDWHFLAEDRTVGGHVLDCRVREGRVRYAVCRAWLIKLARRSDRRPVSNRKN
jgi:acetolactate decarboxylase